MLEWLSERHEISVDKVREKEEPLCTAGGNINRGSHCAKTAWRCLKKLRTELLYDPTVPLLGTY